MAFVRHIPRPAPEAGSTLGFHGLDAIRRGLKSAKGSAQAEREVAQQFEALFISQMLAHARQASGSGGLLDSPQARLAQSLSDGETAQRLAERGLGLADALLAQIGKLTGGIVGKNSMAGMVLSAIEGAPRHIHDFVATMGSAAREAARESGLPEKLILGQAALESGWGRREIRGEDGAASYNLFGIKAGASWKGKVVNVLTTEYEDGVPRKLVQPFRAYDSYAQSFADYARLITGNKRYGAVAEARSPEEAARRIQEAGYATDPAYADKLISVMGYFAHRAGAGGS